MKSRFWIAAIAVSALQTGTVAAIIAKRVNLLANGREIVLDVIPVDPRSLFRGDYVQLNYAISRLPVSLLQQAQEGAGERRVFVTLDRQKAGEDEKWVAVAASTQRPELSEAEDKVVLRGSMIGVVVRGSLIGTPPIQSWSQTFNVRYGIETYFVPEKKGEELEKQARTGAIKTIVAVDRNGNTAIKGLIVGGTMRYDEPLF